MASIKEQAVAIKGYADDIKSAILLMGGSQISGLKDASSAIRAIPSGGTVAGLDASQIWTVSDSGALTKSIPANITLGFISIPSTDTTRPLHYLYFGSKTIKSVSFPNLKSVEGSSAMLNCFNASSLETLDMSVLERVTNGSCYGLCQNCTSLRSINLDSLYQVIGGAFNCAFSNTALTSVDFKSLVFLGQDGALKDTFKNCKSLTEVKFDKLEYVGYSPPTSEGGTPLLTGFGVFNSTFMGCVNLKSLSFPKLKHLANGASSKSTIDPVFDKCDYIETITFGDTVEFVGVQKNHIFDNCTRLTLVDFSVMTREQIRSLGDSTLPWGAPTTCSFKGTDGFIRYQDGVWIDTEE